MECLSRSTLRVASQVATRTCGSRLFCCPSPVAGPSRPGLNDRRRNICTSKSRHADAQRPNSSPPKRPSPYRLLQPHTFIAEFAPLHTEGWRLDAISSQERMINPLSPISISPSPDEQSSGDLQGRRLVRAFVLGEGKEGWRDTMRLAQRAGDVIEEQDHHPTILISPASDYIPSATSLSANGQAFAQERGYILEISTHTHTPFPPYPTPLPKKTPSSSKDGSELLPKIRPGVTGKDINLAKRLEEVWREVMGGRERIEMKRE
ncbi:hypothetical protein IAU59_003826 [Kwoniella sp. CBS 9459]